MVCNRVYYTATKINEELLRFIDRELPWKQPGIAVVFIKKNSLHVKDKELQRMLAKQLGLHGTALQGMVTFTFVLSFKLQLISNITSAAVILEIDWTDCRCLNI